MIVDSFVGFVHVVIPLCAIIYNYAYYINPGTDSTVDDWNYRRRGEGTVEDRSIKLVNEYNYYIYIKIGSCRY